MKNLYIIVIFLAGMLFFNACASAPMSVFVKNFVVPPDYTGIVHAGMTETEKEFAYLNYLGTSWVLNTFYWGSIEPEQNEWNFLSYDTFVNNNRAAGLKVFGVLAYDVGWIHENGKGRNYIPPERIPDFLQFVRNTAEHFRGRVDAWCIWNEPNFHFWTGTDDEFVELFRQAADAIREVDSDVILLGGAFNRGFFGLPEKFIRKLFESGAMEKTDGIAFHPYELNPARSAMLYDRLRRIADDYGFGNKIWVTEVGYPTGGLYPTKASEKRFPEYVIKTFVLLTVRGCNRIFWYQLFDPAVRSAANSENFFGLVRSEDDYTSKGAEAFRLCANYISGTTCYVQEPGRDGIPGSLRIFWFYGNDGGAVVIWNEGLGSRQVSLQIPGTEHTRHDPVTGNMVPIQAGMALTAGTMPIFITWRNARTPNEVN